MTRNIITAVLLGAAFPLSAVAAEANQQATGAATAAAGQLADGEVRKVDKEAKKLTIRHGPLENLGMPPMTMVFQVKDPAMLDKVKAGDKIKFAADKEGGAFTVNQLEVVK
jgi:Cu(I)/Ag(I) efflux system periplasmic protein CusF